MNQLDIDTKVQLSNYVPTTQLSNNLKEIIQLKGINRICVFEGNETEPSCQSQDWAFDDNLVTVGDHLYRLHQLLVFSVRGQVLALHF